MDIPRFELSLSQYLTELGKSINFVSRNKIKLISNQIINRTQSLKWEIDDEIEILNYLIDLEEDESLLNNLLHRQLDPIYEEYEDLISIKSFIENEKLYIEITLPVFKKIIKDDLDRLPSYNWDMEPVDRSFDPDKIITYLDSITDPEIRYITEFIILNSHYINFQTFKESLLRLVDKLPDKFNLIFYYDSSAKVGSEHWVTLLVWPYIRDRVINIISNGIITDEFIELENDYPIVIFDDAIYSGQHIIKEIDLLQSNYNLKRGNINYIEINNLGLWSTIKNLHLKNEFIIAVPYITLAAFYRFNLYQEKVNIKTNLIYDKVVYPIISLLGQVKDFTYTIEQWIDIMREKFNALDINLPIYFDHKIAGPHSSFPDIYSQIVKEQPSRYKIELLERALNEL